MNEELDRVILEDVEIPYEGDRDLISDLNVEWALYGLLCGLRPPPDLTVSQWAQDERVLPKTSSSESGGWENDRTPYLEEIMDCMSPQHPAEDVAFMKPSQIGGTEVLINVAGYYAKHDPCPMGVFQTTEKTAERFTKQRINPSFSAMGLDKLMSGNNLFFKEFPGGSMITGWSNSAANLRSMPLRIALNDEISGWVEDCEGEGDPCDLITARTENFPNKKRFWCSTPGVEGHCRITQKYLAGDQREYRVPCPWCGELHAWKWEYLKWDRDPRGKHLPATARMRCPHCHYEYREHLKTELMSKASGARWVVTNPSGLYPSFGLNALYSPLGWFSWEKMAREFINAQGNISKQKTWTNNRKGEAWQTEGLSVDGDGLLGRREDYLAEVPDGVVLLTAGVDTQDNRLEVEVVGWGKGYESWGITKKILYGNPTQPQVWADLDAVLLAPYRMEDGTELHVAATLQDAMGHHTDEVYTFTGRREYRRVFSSQGRSGAGRPVIGKLSKTTKGKGANLVPVGVDTIKDQLFEWLKLEDRAPGYCHFPKNEEYGDEFFKQLTAEKKTKRYRNSLVVWEYKKTRERNEALDCRVLARAAVNLVGVDLDKLAELGRPYTFNPARGMARKKRGVRSSGARQ